MLYLYIFLSSKRCWDIILQYVARKSLSKGRDGVVMESVGPVGGIVLRASRHGSGIEGFKALAVALAVVPSKHLHLSKNQSPCNA